MEIATLVLSLVASLAKAGLELYNARGADAETAKANLAEAIKGARIAIETLEANLAANDSAADSAAASKPSTIDNMLAVAVSAGAVTKP